MISDGNSLLRSGNFVRVGDERTGPTSYARTFELMFGFECTFDSVGNCLSFYPVCMKSEKWLRKNFGSF